MSLERKFNEDSKNVIKTVIFSLQVCFTGNFVLDCPFKLCFWQIKFSTNFFPDFFEFCSGFSCHWKENLIKILKMCLKLSFFHSKCDLQVILSLIVLSKWVSGSSNFYTTFLPDFTQFFSVFYDFG